MTKVYALTPGDQAIFDKVKKTGDPNWFTNYYLKSPTSGTWWRPGAQSDRWQKGYEFLHKQWRGGGEQENFEVQKQDATIVYNAVWEDDPDYPAFHHHHGFLFQPWQLEVYQRSQRIAVVIGGYGCGKTIAGVASMLTRSATIPGFRGLILAPNSTQAGEIYGQAMSMMYETSYAEKFLFKFAEKPFPKITFANDYIGRSTLQFFPIGDAVGVKKILTLTVDAAFIDQAEEFDDIPDIIRKVGSRMRGQYKGRPMLGKIDFYANANENQSLWDLFDDGELIPQRVRRWQPSMMDNPFITDEQIKDIMQDVGGDDESIRVHLMGGRPKGGGQHFPMTTLAIMEDTTLDEQMKSARENKTPGHVYSEERKVGIYEWQLPRRDKHEYLVIADPGWDNPPKRNAACIMVWDYTDFPAVPAHLVAFHWVFGHNSPIPWITRYTELVDYYQSHWANAIDATGAQSGYEKLVARLEEVNVQGMSLAGSYKFTYLNFAKGMAAKGHLRIPNIPAIFQQLSKYRLPDDKIAQDIVMTFCLTAGWLESRFYVLSGEKEPEAREYPEDDRYYRESSESDRYESRENFPESSY